jgi:hypothetical protein
VNCCNANEFNDSCLANAKSLLCVNKKRNYAPQDSVYRSRDTRHANGMEVNFPT